MSLIRGVALSALTDHLSYSASCALVCQVLDALAERLQDAGPSGRAAWYQARAFVLDMHSRSTEALDATQRALDLATTPRDVMLATKRCLFGREAQGRLQEARALLARTARVVADEPDVQGDWLDVLTRHPELQDINATQHLALLKRRADLHRRRGRLADMVSAYVEFVEASYACGHLEEAFTLATQIDTLATRFGMFMEVIRVRTTLILYHAEHGDPDVAVDMVARVQALTGTAATGIPNPIERLIGGYVYAKAGDDEAMRHLVEPLDPATLHFFGFCTRVLHALVDELLDRGHLALARRLNDAALRRWQTVGDEDKIASCRRRTAALNERGA